ncbi:MAG: hypothetical protein IJP54_06840 [Synergistaceae bacterium]|nr:hypothetical protein [Synergistaceae bacterium]
MTKKLLTAMLLLAVMSSAAWSDVAITPENFPDPVWGPSLFMYDSDGDGTLSDAELAAVDGIHVQESGISSLKGIEYFTNITQLNCTDNNIAELDVSKCTKLEYLWCARNQMTSLNINGCYALEHINCEENSLTGTLDLSNRTALREVYCRQNDLTSLVVDGCYALERVYCRSNRLAGTLDLSNRRNLVEVVCRSNNLTGLNVTGCDALEKLACFTKADDGPEHTNHITTLDLKGKSRLQELNVRRNSLTALDLADCTALISLDCEVNQITALDISHSPNLRMISCGSNDIKTLDVTHNTALKHLNAYDCGLSALDLSKNIQLEYLELGGYDNANNNRLTTIDLSRNTKLTYLAVDRNQLTELDVSMLPSLERLYFLVNPIADIDLSHNPKLKELYCRTTSLTELDLSANPELTLLRCRSNDFTTLDLSRNPSVSDLNCDSNPMRILTVSESGNSQYPYQSDLKPITGDSFTRIQSLNAYTSSGSLIASAISGGTAFFSDIPETVIYAYNLGYTGSANIARVMNVTLLKSGDVVPLPDDESVFSVSVSLNSLTIPAGSTATLSLTPANALGTVSYSANLSWVTFSGNTAMFAPTSAGTYTVVITATDSGRTSGNTATASISVTVTQPDTPSPDFYLTADISLSMYVSTSEDIALTPNNPLGTVIYSATVSPSDGLSVSFRGNTAILTAQKGGNYTVLITATDTGRTSGSTAATRITAEVVSPAGSSGGGCNPGFSALVLAALVFFRRH